jgi:hypothetical protein
LVLQEFLLVLEPQAQRQKDLRPSRGLLRVLRQRDPHPSRELSELKQAQVLRQRDLNPSRELLESALPYP